MNAKLLTFFFTCLATSQLSIPWHNFPVEAKTPLVTEEMAQEEISQQEILQEEIPQQETSQQETEGQGASDEFNYEEIANTFPQIPTETSSAVAYNDSKSWWFKRTDSGQPPSAQHDISILDYDAYYLGDTSRKVIYLTFDEGYEMGYTTQILDTLKDNDVKAAFFVTYAFLRDEPELALRMAEEGHVVANHSVTHPSFSTLSDEEILAELTGCADCFKEITGYDMAPFFRPPAGEYSIRSLEKTQEAGYKTIFWSYAYRDWVTDDQPGKDVAYQNAITYDHNGCIMLLHAVSKSNTEALDDILKTLKSEGYSFESLYDLPDSAQLLNALESK